eukprot:7046063-Pyramimonas_sp.AAC.1
MEMEDVVPVFMTEVKKPTPVVEEYPPQDPVPEPEPEPESQSFGGTPMGKFMSARLRARYNTAKFLELRNDIRKRQRDEWHQALKDWVECYHAY